MNMTTFIQTRARRSFARGETEALLLFPHHGKLLDAEISNAVVDVMTRA
jgi:hypothetical protein